MDLELLRKDNRSVTLQECSALKGEGVWEGLATLAMKFDDEGDNAGGEVVTPGGGSTAAGPGSSSSAREAES